MEQAVLIIAAAFGAATLWQIGLVIYKIVSGNAPEEPITGQPVSGWGTPDDWRD